LIPQKTFSFDSFASKYYNSSDHDKIENNQKMNSKFNLYNFNRVMNWANKRKSININIFNDVYYLSVDSCHKIGDAMKTLDLWLDIDPCEFVICNRCNCMFNDKIWNSIEKGGSDFNVELRKNCFNPMFYKVIIFEPKRMIFKENNKRFQLTVHKELKLKTIKKVLVNQN
jgi:hypothetical protein